MFGAFQTAFTSTVHKTRLRHFPTSPDPGGLLRCVFSCFGKESLRKEYKMKIKILHEKREYLNVRDAIEGFGDMYNGKVAFRYRVNPHDKEPVIVKYEELRDDVRAIATEMISRGLVGKKIVVIGKSSYQWIETYYSTLAAGAILVPLDRDWSAEDLCDTVKTAEADFIICDKDIEAKGNLIAEELSLPAPLLLNTEGENTLHFWRIEGAKRYAEDQIGRAHV